MGLDFLDRRKNEIIEGITSMVGRYIINVDDGGKEIDVSRRIAGLKIAKNKLENWNRNAIVGTLRSGAFLDISPVIRNFDVKKYVFKLDQIKGEILEKNPKLVAEFDSKSAELEQKFSQKVGELEKRIEDKK